ncbi:biotin-independent malonate decarboxylase subunit beta [uncultured Marinobacter sp.]|uniref:biotin-independent malonate decarboxylase subunit beta n=1 Tax=uncultured Marinobacter sp. TaxID=187379 RepID=UPI0025F824EC|nr:biotin-independent malonate decarboxylase subunit beta [uncultured Marinobacter sp.]
MSSSQSKGFVDLSARKRVEILLDRGSMHELLSPFDKVTSPWLEKQGIVPQFDDGVVVAKGTIGAKSTVIAAIEGSFQGGSLGEVGGAKIAGLLELALEENKKGNPTAAVLLLESGGVRLQEANLGLGAIAEIQAGIVELRTYQPVVGVITGPVGCFGGMSIAAGLCSYLIMTREGRLGLNGPQVIEQEAGIDEYDSRNRDLIWGLTGGTQRFATGLADVLVDDDVDAMCKAVQGCLAKGVPAHHRSDEILGSLENLLKVDTSKQITADVAYQILTGVAKNDDK